jgi:hypothetical protein
VQGSDESGSGKSLLENKHCSYGVLVLLPAGCAEGGLARYFPFPVLLGPDINERPVCDVLLYVGFLVPLRQVRLSTWVNGGETV